MGKTVWLADTFYYNVQPMSVHESTVCNVWREEGQVPGKFIYRESRSQAVIDLCNAIDEEVVRLMEIKNNLKGS